MHHAKRLHKFQEACLDCKEVFVLGVAVQNVLSRLLLLSRWDRIRAFVSFWAADVCRLLSKFDDVRCNLCTGMC